MSEENLSSKVVSDLKRLQRHGSELSELNQKLMKAAFEIQEVIAQQIPKNIRYIGKYTVRGPHRGDGGVERLEFSDYRAVPGDSLQSAFYFAQDIAGGMLEDIVKIIEEDKKNKKPHVDLLEALVKTAKEFKNEGSV